MPEETRLSDIDQGKGDAELFREATDAPTLKDFENPQLPLERPEPDQPQKTDQVRDEQGRFQKADRSREQPPDDQEARIPSGRLREESEARRRAEQEIQDLRARIAAYEVNRQQPQQQPQKKLDIFDDPAAFVRQEMTPILQQMEAANRLNLERQSTENAQRLYGHEIVDNAYNSLAMGMRNSDPQAWAVYNSAMGSHDPYGVITRWFVDRRTLSEIGGDLEAYKQRIREEALRDPAYQKQVYNAMRGQATTQINQPISSASNPPSPSIPPSLSEIGATGGEDFIHEPSDEALFRAAVSAKRRPTGLR
jgi:hypothetical protein